MREPAKKTTRLGLKIGDPTIVVFLLACFSFITRNGMSLSFSAANSQRRPEDLDPQVRNPFPGASCPKMPRTEPCVRQRPGQGTGPAPGASNGRPDPPYPKRTASQLNNCPAQQPTQPKNNTTTTPQKGVLGYQNLDV